MERDWVDYASAIGNTATALTLIVVLIKEYKTRKDIQDLTVIAKELQRQNALQAMQMKNSAHPNIGATGIMTTEPNIFLCNVLNYGTPLEVTWVVNHYEGDLTLQPVEVPFQLSIHQPLQLRFLPKNSHTFLDKKYFMVEVSVSDIYNNSYAITLEGYVVNSEGPTPKIEILEDEDEETADSLLYPPAERN